VEEGTVSRVALLGRIARVLLWASLAFLLVAGRAGPLLDQIRALGERIGRCGADTGPGVVFSVRCGMIKGSAGEGEER
jgi:hypothetical protein